MDQRKREELTSKLHIAAEVEQQVLLLYLYAAFSMKRHADATCLPSQWEAVRRWGSQLLMVARQEMEHLALVQNILVSIGEKPYFGRSNFVPEPPGATALKAAPQPIHFPIELRPFDLETLQFFICIESPTYETLKANGQRIPHWCFECDDRLNLVKAVRNLGLNAKQDAPGGEIWAGEIEELYDEIKALLETCTDADFSSAGQVDIPNEFNIYVWNVNDRASAIAAVDLITKQGEGTDAEPFFDSHYSMFYKMYDEYQAILRRSPNFNPSYPWKVVQHESEIRNELTRRVFKLCNDSYVNLMYLLSGLYYQFNASNNLSIALQQATFAPMMTMFNRPLFELLARMPIDTSNLRTGPTFYLSPAEQAILKDPGDTQSFDVHSLNDQVMYFNRHIRDEVLAIKQAMEADGGYTQQLINDVEYIYQNAYRFSNNLVQVNTQGMLPRLDPAMQGD